MTTTILIIVNVFAALAIIVLALMQQSKGDMGSAFGGGGSQSMFGSRGSANFLSRSTAIMCAVFFISSLALAYVYAKRAESSSVVQGGTVIEQTVEATAEPEVPTIKETGVPTIPDADVTVPTTSVEALENKAEELIEENVPAVPQ